jgi:hypothetical protein
LAGGDIDLTDAVLPNFARLTLTSESGDITLPAFNPISAQISAVAGNIYFGGSLNGLRGEYISIRAGQSVYLQNVPISNGGDIEIYGKLVLVGLPLAGRKPALRS